MLNNEHGKLSYKKVLAIVGLITMLFIYSRVNWNATPANFSNEGMVYFSISCAIFYLPKTIKDVTEIIKGKNKDE